ncbi:MAG: 16S rRNA (guanine(966)-N(2))-methyltransferase RsmD [Thermoleophilaceae bacterium]
MTLRVVAGRFGGRRIAAPAGSRTRPTAERVREALFSMLGPLDGVEALDLFAGSGALGIEAISRGAAAATFVDTDRRAIAAIRANLAVVGLAAEVRRCDALSFLAAAAGRGYDLVFLDPPYSSAGSLAAPLSERLPTVLSENALIISESDKRAPLELTLPLERERFYGDTRIAVHRGR